MNRLIWFIQAEKLFSLLQMFMVSLKDLLEALEALNPESINHALRLIKNMFNSAEHEIYPAQRC